MEAVDGAEGKNTLDFASYRRDLDSSILPEVTIRNRTSTGFIKLTGVIIADHIKSLDWLERDARYAGDIPIDIKVYSVRELNTHVLYTFRTAGAWLLGHLRFYTPFAPLVLGYWGIYVSIHLSHRWCLFLGNA